MPSLYQHPFFCGAQIHGRRARDVAPVAVVEINSECVVTLAPVDTGDGAGLAVGVFGLFFFLPRCWDDGVGGRR